MCPKLAIAALLAAGTVGMTAGAATAAPFERHDRERFEVLVRHRGHWEVQGTYDSREQAERSAHRLERRGQDARIECVRR